MVTIDCADPQRLATFWTEAAGYRIEGDFGFFIVLVPAVGGVADGGVDGGAAAGGGGAGGRGLAIGLQKVPERRVAKNRVHIDWHSDDRLAEVERLVKLGATVLGEEKVPGLTWTVLADPDGNEFCVAG
jgi:predicted enzyme related to lactoylglutathione lyase